MPLDTLTNRGFAFAIGLLIGVLTLQTQYPTGDARNLLARIVPVDILCALLLLVLFFRHRMEKPPFVALLYVGAVVLALVPAFFGGGGPESDVWVALSAFLMAFSFYLAGLNLGTSRTLLRWLMGGLCLGVFAQGIVVYHDLLSPVQWFPDPMEGRVRGTFRFNGQLGAYGFSAAGILITFGATLAKERYRGICVAAAILAASFIIAASRRTGMLSLFAWGVLFLVLGARFSGKRFYAVFATCFLGLLLLLGVFWLQVESSFAGRRFTQAVDSLGQKEGFIQNQLRRVVDTAPDWLPFGFGVGRGARIDPQDGHEVHNSLLAVLVELGVLGLLGFTGMVIHPLLKRRWQKLSPEHARLGFLLTTFLLVSFLFMMHNTLYRDRPFLLFLGIATTLVLREGRLRAASGLLVPERRPAGKNQTDRTRHHLD